MAWFLSLLFFFLISSVTACDRCVYQSKASHYYDDRPTSYGGTCGYGSLEFDISKGFYTAAGPSLYKQGIGCGACYQVRCKNKRLCNTKGTKVVLTDQNYENKTEFFMGKKAFSAMALKGKGEELLKIDNLDVEYKRIPCDYKSKNLMVQVVEWSSKPYYLAIKFLYQGGQTDIQAVNIAQVGFPKWSPMKKHQGAIWDSNNVPRGALQISMMVSSGYNRKWIYANYVLPAAWRNGEIYDTGMQIKDIAAEYCRPYNCGDKPWN
ncbi:hypothetical protein IC582_003486 [Cucumis melo]|uniref:Expansin-like A1 n=3 Tax=Cucumis melo TaxID=3656 RepID=A0ABM3KH73_CUCME|nr:expansin-like A1 [Cucumis melo]